MSVVNVTFRSVAIDLVGLIEPASHRYILTLVHNRLGIAEEILSDQGTQFILDCKEGSMQAPWCHTVYDYTVSSDVQWPGGKFNGTLNKFITRLRIVKPEQKCSSFMYREVPQDPSYFAPFELMFGKAVRGPIHILRELTPQDIDKQEVKAVRAGPTATGAS